MVSDEALSEAITQAMAKQVLGSLSDEHKEAYLSKAVAQTLKSFTVTYKIHEVVTARANEIVKEMLEKPHWQEQLHAAIRTGMEQYLSQLPVAVASMLTEVFHGKDGYGSYGGLILKHMHKEGKKV